MTQGLEEVKKVLDGCKDKVYPVVISALADLNYPEVFRVPEKYDLEAGKHWEMVRDYPDRQGKYVRPTLLVMMARSMGVDDESLYRLAGAMQLSEEWILVHDDFEDDSVLRRGKPALHRIVGSELAVNAGDALHLLMWKVLYEVVSGLEKEKADRIFGEFVTMLTRTALGQSVELFWARDGRSDFSDEDWFFLADGKTCYYTIAGPMRLGAIYAGAGERELEVISRFGVALGRCFQLVDDILDVRSDFSGLKEWANDIYEGKGTVILGHVLRNLVGTDRQRLVEIIGKKRDEKTLDEVKWVVGKMEECGSVEYARELAKKFAEKAIVIFEKEMDFVSEVNARKSLRMLIEFILHRDR